MMKKSLILGLMLISATVAAVGLVPPKYLAIHGFKHCLEKEYMQTWERWCMPHEKPASCEQHAWDQLQQLSGRDRPADCRH